MKKDTAIKKMVYIALMTALVCVATMVIKIPSPTGGYANLGDGFIFASAIVLGPWAAFAGGVGSALADLFSGYMVFVPATLIIKGLMGLLVGAMCLRKSEKMFCMKDLVAFVLAEIIMVGGYFLFERFILGDAGAAGGIFSNLGQAGVGIVIGLILAPIMRRMNSHLKK